MLVSRRNSEKKSPAWKNYLFTILFAVMVMAFSQCSMSVSENGLEHKDLSKSLNAKALDISSNRLTGVNWFGFETGNGCPHGLWARDYKSMIQQIKDLGFNCIRLPYCDDMFSATPNSIQINASGVDAYTHITGLNLDLAGLSSIQVMDKIVDECGRQGIRIILDRHSGVHDGYMNETLWYSSYYTEAQWINDWVTLVNRYKNSPAVVGADLKNEPHGNMTSGMKPPATWGYDEPGQGTTDWKAAAERCGQAILAANPNLLIIVEGTEEFTNETYWWGGNLSGVGVYPITAIPKANLVYSAHEYGPEVYPQTWFSDPSFPNNMQAIWDKHFWFIYSQNIAPLFFGEFGIQEASAANPSSAACIWFTKFMALMGNKCSWTFWCFNPDSGDTGGILQDDWVSVNTAKYNLIKPYLAGNTTPISSSSFSSLSSSSSVKSSSSSSISSSSSSVTTSSSSSSSVNNSVDLPGKIIAANYNAMSGIQTETASEGGLDVGWIDAGDWMDYNVNVASAGSYNVEYRVASLTGGGSAALQTGGATLATTSLPNTGGWQTYTSVNTTVNLNAGQQTLRVMATAGGWNITWLNFTKTGASSSSSSAPVSSSSSSSSAVSSSSSSSSSSNGGVYSTITAPFTFDGAGTYHWKIASVPSYINDWNLSALNINGTSFLNLYTGVSQLPAQQGGYYYIDYTGPYAWSHIEIK